jgi:hypothetical protein
VLLRLLQLLGYTTFRCPLPCYPRLPWLGSARLAREQGWGRERHAGPGCRGGALGRRPRCGSWGRELRHGGPHGARPKAAACPSSCLAGWGALEARRAGEGPPAVVSRLGALAAVRCSVCALRGAGLPASAGDEECRGRTTGRSWSVAGGAVRLCEPEGSVGTSEAGGGQPSSGRGRGHMARGITVGKRGG